MIFHLIYSLLKILAVLIPVLLAIAFMTVLERKAMGEMQRRIGPNTTFWFGSGQAFADFLKLILKETIIPNHSNQFLFYIAPISILILSLAGWAIVPFGPGLFIFDYPLGILYTLALSSLAVYGILIAGWSANSKYAFLGSLRSTAAMISYELILSTSILVIIFLTGSLSFSTIVESQQAIWFIIPLFPVFIFYFISVLAETSRTPFDLQEAESELVSGFMTEHSSVPFIFFFLGEYSSIVLFSCITAILFLGGYNAPELFDNCTPLALSAVNLGLKSCVFCFLFVLVRATLPRLRFDQLIALCWYELLPIAVGLVLFVPSILIAFSYLPY